MATTRKDKLLRTVGIIALVGAVAFYLFKKAASKVWVQDIKMQIDSSSFTELKGRILMSMKNQLGVSVPVQSFTGALYYGTYNLADLNLTSNVVLATGETTILPIEFEVQYAQMAANLITLFQAGTYLLPFAVKGTLVVEGLSIPIEQRITII